MYNYVKKIHSVYRHCLYHGHKIYLNNNYYFKLCSTFSSSQLQVSQNNNENIITNSKEISPKNEDAADSFGNMKLSLEKLNKKKSEIKTQKKKATKIIIKSKNNEANEFGNLSKSNGIWYPDFDEETKTFTDPSESSTIIKPIHRKFRDGLEYLVEMKRLTAQKKLKEALDLFLDMKRNNVVPIPPNYTFMIGACGKAGYTEMAFKLLRQMTDKGFRPTPATLTGLFNSCAESPFPDYGLKKAKFLKEKIAIKTWECTQPTYHAMIKAFGKCGDMKTAFQIVDEMAAAGIKIDLITYSFLLMTCITDKEAGFTYAIEVWRKMKERNQIPNLFSCNLLLRAARDCDVGPEEISSILLQHWTSYPKRPYGFDTKKITDKTTPLQLVSSVPTLSKVNETENFIHDASKNIEKCDAEEIIDKLNNKIQVTKIQDNIAIQEHHEAPNFLTTRPINGPEILSINVKTPHERLALLGGVEGFLEYMIKNKIQPSIKTFMLLLEILPPSLQEEEHLLALLDKYKVKPDVDFFNILIKRRNYRKDISSARNVLKLINKYNLSPDIATFGVLSMGCLKRIHASYLIKDMQKLDVAPNIEIIGCFIHNACRNMDFNYLENILQIMKKFEIKPNEKILTKLEISLNEARKNIIDMEHGKEVKEIYKIKDFPKKYKLFCSTYEEWLKNMEVEITEHPWAQYKTEITEKIKQEVYSH